MSYSGMSGVCVCVCVCVCVTHPRPCIRCMYRFDRVTVYRAVVCQFCVAVKIKQMQCCEPRLQIFAGIHSFHNKILPL